MAKTETSPAPDTRTSTPATPQQMVTLRVWRGDPSGGRFEAYSTPVTEGMVVLDAVHRVQEFRKCIECYLRQDVFHVLREPHDHDQFIGPRVLVQVDALEVEEVDNDDRVSELKQPERIGYCHITMCCTKDCPENITI